MDVARGVLTKGIEGGGRGVSREKQESGGQTLVIFALGLLFVFLLLAAQYELRTAVRGRPLGAASGARRSHADA